MTASELRIGNFVNAMVEGRVYIVKGYSPIDIWEQSFEEDTICIESSEPDKYGSFSTDIETINAIPLTEEWLLKFGCKKRETFNNGLKTDEYISLQAIQPECEYSAGFEWDYNKLYLCDCDSGKMGKQIQFVHELQNLYFALTGEELIPK